MLRLSVRLLSIDVSMLLFAVVAAVCGCCSCCLLSVLSCFPLCVSFTPVCLCVSSMCLHFLFWLPRVVLRSVLRDVLVFDSPI